MGRGLQSGKLRANLGSLAARRSRFGFAILAFADGSGLPFSLHPPLAALESQLCKVHKAVTECTARERPWLPLRRELARPRNLEARLRERERAVAAYTKV